MVFVTGTDTGVGKTLLTAHLLCHLRRRGIRALGMKPFCSGGTGDVNLIQSMQAGELSNEEANPFYFAKPVAPLVAARKSRRTIRLADVVGAVERVADRCDVLVVEGVGGLLVPLGEEFGLLDLIVRFNGSTILVARNKLGTINHTLLTLEALRRRGLERIQVVLMGQRRTDASVPTNADIIKERLVRVPVISLPYLGKSASQFSSVQRSEKKIKKTLAVISGFAIFTARSSKRLSKAAIRRD
jgi:dethiobiotin synthetase